MGPIEIILILVALLVVFIVIIALFAIAIRMIFGKSKRDKQPVLVAGQSVSGIVESFQADTAKPMRFGEMNQSLTIWRFRVARYNEAGDRNGPSVEVQLQGQEISGRIANGDSVRLDNWIPGTVLLTNHVFNETTQTHVIAR